MAFFVPMVWWETTNHTDDCSLFLNPTSYKERIVNERKRKSLMPKSSICYSTYFKFIKFTSSYSTQHYKIEVKNKDCGR